MKTKLINDYDEVKRFLMEHNLEYNPRNIMAFKFVDLENEETIRMIINKLNSDPNWLSKYKNKR